MICAAIDGEKRFHEQEGYPLWFTIVQYSFSAEWYCIESKPVTNRSDCFHVVLEPHRLVTIS